MKDLGPDDEGWCFPGINVKGVVGPIASWARQATAISAFPSRPI